MASRTSHPQLLQQPMHRQQARTVVATVVDAVVTVVVTAADPAGRTTRSKHCLISIKKRRPIISLLFFVSSPLADYLRYFIMIDSIM